jgi:hypothetical protein
MGQAFQRRKGKENTFFNDQIESCQLDSKMVERVKVKNQDFIFYRVRKIFTPQIKKVRIARNLNYFEEMKKKL